MKLEFSRQIVEKYSNIKLHKNPSSGSGILSGQTYRHYKTYGRSSAFFEHA